METIKIGLLLSSESNYNQIKELIYQTPRVEERFVSYSPVEAQSLMGSKNADILLVSDRALSNSNFPKVACKVASINTMVLLEAHEQDPPAAFLIFSLANKKCNPLLFKSVVNLANMGSIAYCDRVSKAIKNHGEKIITPSSRGITQREIEVVNVYSNHHSQKLTAEQLNKSISTVDTTLGNVLAKLGLKSLAELIPFLKANHWCNLESGEVIWF